MLSDQQKLLILQAAETNPAISLNELVNISFPDNLELDGRSKEGRAVRALLTENHIKARTSNQYEKKEITELSDGQKEFVSNNCASMSAVEISRTLFNNQKISNLNIEARIVQDFINTLSPRASQPEDDEDSLAEYKPPKTIEKAISRINKYVLNGYDKSNLKPSQKKNVEAFINYMHSYRFVHQMNTYSSESYRPLFESSFVRYTYDKSDLSQEEVDQYIVLCTDIVIGSSIQARINILQDLLDNTATDTDGGRISMSLVQSISTAQTEYNQCINRQQKILSDLKVKRSARLEGQGRETASILNLITLWKDEENRTAMLRLAELRKAAIKKEIERLTSLDEIKCKILGINENEVLNG